MQATFFSNFSKRKNSTKRPVLSTGTTHNVRFKESTSTENPTLMIQGVNLNYNYLYMNGSYYFINDIILQNNNIYELNCSMDILATWKEYIENYTGFIYRTSAPIGGNSGLIRDGNVQGLDIYNYDKHVVDYPGFNNSGCYIIKTVSPKYRKYYFLTGTELAVLLNELNSQQFFENTEGWKDFIFIRFAPFDRSYFVNDVTELDNKIYIGNHIVSSSQPIYSTEDNIIEKGPLTIDTSYPFLENFGDWRDYSNEWTSIEYMFFNNKVSLPIEYNKKPIYLSFVYDFASGNCTIKALDKNSLELMNHEVFTINFKYAFDIQVAQSTATLWSAVPDIFGLVTNLMSKNAVGALGGSFNTLNGTLQNHPATIGQLTDMSCLKWAPQIYIFRKRRVSADIPSEQAGTPVCIVRRVGDIGTGCFIQLSNASIDIPGLGGEKDALNSLLNGGFYYE